MRIARAIPIHWTGPSGARPLPPSVVTVRLVEEPAPVATLPPPMRGDAAWLTLLMAQTFGATLDVTGAQRAYAPASLVAPVMALSA